jgi:thiamine-monophosphate kinase
MKLSEMGEDRFLAELRERIPDPSSHVTLGIGDDAAGLAIPHGESALVSTDVLVEGVHFTRQTLPPRFIGRKAVAVNASDIAAMGGRPVGILVALSVNVETEEDEVLELIDGVVTRCSELTIDFVGGNLSASPGPMMVSVSILGTSLEGNMLTRAGARSGDAIYVSGKLGAAAEGLDLLQEGMAVSAAGALLVPSGLRDGPVPLAEICLRAHMDPEPRIDLGQFLCKNGAASSCIDTSDGLVRDLIRLCRESRVGGRIEETALPIHPAVLAWERLRRRPPLEQALSGGEDYELLFTSSDEKILETWRDSENTPLTRIGTVTEASEGVRLVLREGTERELTTGGWDHFQTWKSPR